MRQYDPRPYHLCVGVDIAATTFTASWMRNHAQAVRRVTFEQTAHGFRAFQQRLQATGVPPAATLIVLEATGRSWVGLAVTLHDAG